MKFNPFRYLAIRDTELLPWTREFSINKSYLALNKICMQQSACWPIDYTHYLPAVLSFFNRPLQLVFFTLTLAAGAQIAFLFFYSFVMKLTHPTPETTLTEISDCFIQSIIYTFSCILLVYYRLRHGKLVEMIDYMDANFRQRSAIGKSLVTIEPSYLLAKRFTTVWFTLLLGAVLYVPLQPILTLTWRLPLPQLQYPFDVFENTWVFLGIYVSQFLGQAMVGYLITDFENHLLSTSILMCGQLDILFCSFKNIRNTAMLLNGLGNRTKLKKMATLAPEANEYYYSFEIEENLDDLDYLKMQINKEIRPALVSNRGRPDDNYLNEYQHELFVALRSCIHHHNVLLEMNKLMENFFNPLILLSSFQATLQICNLAYVSSKPAPVEEVIHNLQYLVMTTLALLMIGYSGDCLKAHSDGIGAALLRCPWHLCGGPFRRDLMIIMKNTLKPMVLTGGKFFVLDYEKVKAILSATFSYYTVLQNIG